MKRIAIAAVALALLISGCNATKVSDLQSRGEFMSAATALRDAGVSGVAFYNYGHLRTGNIAWIADAAGLFGG